MNTALRGSIFFMETERLQLRPTDLSDASFMLELLNTPQFIEHIGDRNVRTLEDAEEYIQLRIIPQFERLGYGSYTIIEKATGQKIGTCGLYDREELEINDIGFALLPPFEGKGLAYEASKAVMDFANRNFGITKFSAITTNANNRSQTLIERLGLSFKKHVRLTNDPEDLRYYEN